MEINSNLRKITFKGAGFEAATQGLRFLQTNQAVGATLVDVGAMAVPRTLVDMTRSKEAGKETARREFAGVFNHAFIGLYGLLAGSVISFLFNRKNNVQAQKLVAGTDTIDSLAKIWKENPDDIEEFFKSALKQVEGFGSEWKKINPETIENTAKKLVEEVKNSGKFALDKNIKKELKSDILQDILSENTVKFGKISTALENVLNDVYSFAKIIKTTGLESVENLKHLKIKTGITGIALASAVGFSVQALNNYITRKNSGKDGFVGVEGRKKDDSMLFKTVKALVAGAFGTFAYKTIQAKGFTDLINKIQFKSIFPTVPQYKVVYGLTIVGRILACRDFNELRETPFRDLLGFSNWLILGSFVQKLVANALNPSLVKYEGKVGKGLGAKFKWLVNSTVKSHDEIIAEGLPKGMKMAKMSIKEMLKNLPEESKKLLRHTNIAVVAGLLYSALVLGIGIPKLNIYLTKKFNKKSSDKVVFNGIKTDMEGFLRKSLKA